MSAAGFYCDLAKPSSKLSDQERGWEQILSGVPAALWGEDPHNLQSMVGCCFLAGRVGRFCRLRKFRELCGFKICGAENAAIPIPCVRVPLYPNHSPDLDRADLPWLGVSAPGSAILIIMSWSRSSAFSALALQETRASLYQDSLLAFTLSFRLGLILSAFSCIFSEYQ